MNFLTAAVKEALGPKTTVTEILKDVLSKPSPPRSIHNTHASDLTKPGFCPRKVALLTKLKIEPKPESPGPAMRATFDVGDAYSTLVREKWMGTAAVGNWRCTGCGRLWEFVAKPSVCTVCYGAGHHGHEIHYEEVRFLHPTLKFSGGIDVFANVGAAKLMLVEIKSIKAEGTGETWETIKAPLAEHRQRTCLYLKLIADCDSPLKARINTEQAIVLYVSKGFGKKLSDQLGVLPFKEFVVDRDDSCLKEPLLKAQRMELFRSKGILPPHQCTNPNQPEAKGCSVLAKCFENGGPQSQPVDTQMGPE